MNGRSRSNARPRAPDRRGAATTATGAEPRWHCAVLLGLLLALAALPVQASEREAGVQERLQSAILDSAIVPASANWVVLEAT
jgi:hypothetical protein